MSTSSPSQFPTLVNINTTTTGPTPEPTFGPTTVQQLYENVSWARILSIFYYQLVFAGFLWVLFEVMRPRARNIYCPRRNWDDRTPPLPSSWPFAWVPAVVAMPESEVLQRVGLDAFMLIRFIRLCKRFTLFTSVVGCVVLIPVFSAGNGGFEGFNGLTINNLSSDKGLWLSTSFMLIFTGFAYFLFVHEYENYVKWRVAYLSEGSVDDLKYQSRYTIQIDGLPSHLRTNVALEKFLDEIFPGKVYCANVQFELSELEHLHDHRHALVDSLERAVAFEHIMGKTKHVRISQNKDTKREGGEEEEEEEEERQRSKSRRKVLPRFCCCSGERVEAVPYLRDELAAANAAALEIQRLVHVYQRSPSADVSNELPTEDAVSEEERLATRENVSIDTHNEEAVVGNSHPDVLASPNTPPAVEAPKTPSAATWHNCLSRRAIRIAKRTAALTRSGKHPHNADTAFATMTSEFSASVAAAGFLVSKSNTLITKFAPEATDMIWKNVVITSRSRHLRSWLAGGFFILIGIFWSALISLLSTFAIASGELLVNAGINRTGLFFNALMKYIPVTLQLGVLCLIPILVQFTGTFWEGIQSNTELQGVVYSRYFLFQLVNILVTIGSVSFFVFFQDYGLSDVPSLLVDTFPRLGGYFIEFILLKTMFGLAWELSRGWPLIQMIVATACTDKRQWTKRSLREAYLSCPELLYGWVYPSVLSVAVISFTYAVVTPIVSVFSLAFFVVAEVVYTNNALWVYSAKSESGGALWNATFKRLVSGLAFSHLLLGCYLLAKTAYWQMLIMWALILTDFVCATYCYRVYEWPSAVIPLSVAVAKDRTDRDQLCRVGKSNQLYEQPSLRLEAVEEEPFTSPEPRGPFSMADAEIPARFRMRSGSSDLFV